MFEGAVDEAGALDADIAELSTSQLADCVAATHNAHQIAGCRMLLLAAAWADAHPRLAPVLNDFGKPYPGADRGRSFGADTNPEASEFCPVEFGALQATSTASAALMIGDALDLRHRLPFTWQRVVTGDVNPAKARRVAQATRQLTDEAAGLVDRGIAEHLATLPWGRFLLVLASLVIEADPRAAASRAQAAERERFVHATSANPAGLKLLIAQASAGDVITFLAMVNRIADILLVSGDPDPVDVRRSKAIGILAQPAYALELLITHQHQPQTSHARSLREVPDEVPPREDLARIGRRFDALEVTDAAGSEAEVPGGDLAWFDNARPSEPAEPGDGMAVPRVLASDDERQSVRLDVPVDVDHRKLRPTATLFVHLTDQALRTGIGVARFEDVGPVTVEQVRRFLGGGTPYDIRIQPVIDPADVAAVDAYEIPLRLREAVRIRNVADVYPYGTCTSRRMDLDHTIAYQPMDDGGPPGQTGPDNLGPLDRTHHRDKTHGLGNLRQPESGIYLYRSPEGWVYVTTNAGTLNLGKTPYAHALWTQAQPWTLTA